MVCTAQGVLFLLYATLGLELNGHNPSRLLILHAREQNKQIGSSVITKAHLNHSGNDFFFIQVIMTSKKPCSQNVKQLPQTS